MSQKPFKKKHHSIPDQVLESSLNLFVQWLNESSNFEIPQNIEHRQSVHSLLDQLFRRLGYVDWLIARYCSSRKTSRDLHALLRLGVCQVLYSGSLPAPIAVDTCVRLARSRFSQREAGFVNAVLRRLIREKELLVKSDETLPDEARYNLGRELIGQWRRHFTETEIARLARLLEEPSPLVVRERRPLGIDLGEESELPDVLQSLPAFAWAGGERFWQCGQPRAFFQSSAFQRGQFYVQDPSTVLAPILLQAAAGELIGDFCAAPGGKSVLLRERMGQSGRLVCCDRDDYRLRRLRENMPGEGGVAIMIADAVHPPFTTACFNGVLLDVPCSNSGVWRRRPDARWRFSRQKLRHLRDLQWSILAGSAGVVAPGGRLVYSTCSIEPDENQEQVSRFLKAFPHYRLESEEQLLPAALHDGAYAARLRRSQE